MYMVLCEHSQSFGLGLGFAVAVAGSVSQTWQPRRQIAASPGMKRQRKGTRLILTLTFVFIVPGLEFWLTQSFICFEKPSHVAR